MLSLKLSDLLLPCSPLLLQLCLLPVSSTSVTVSSTSVTVCSLPLADNTKELKNTFRNSPHPLKKEQEVEGTFFRPPLADDFEMLQLPLPHKPYA